MTKKAVKLGQAEVDTAIDAALSLAKTRLASMQGEEIDGVAGGAPFPTEDDLATSGAIMFIPLGGDLFN